MDLGSEGREHHLSVAHRLGPDAILIDLPIGVSPRVLSQKLLDEQSNQLIEVVAGETTILIRFTDTSNLKIEDIFAMAELIDDKLPEPSGRTVEVPVKYDGPDLERVANSCNMDIEEVVRFHTEARYVVEFIGFAPGFGYLGGLNERLHLPRLPSPRKAVPRGSVAIADRFCSIYPSSSPGGWNIIGETNLAMFDQNSDPPSLLRPGDEVLFKQCQ